MGGVVAVPAAATLLSPVLDRRRRDAWRPLGPVDDFPPGTTQKALVEVPRDDWVQSLGVQAVYVWHSEAEGLVVFSRKCTDLGTSLAGASRGPERQRHHAHVAQRLPQHCRPYRLTQLAEPFHVHLGVYHKGDDSEEDVRQRIAPDAGRPGDHPS